MFKTICVFVVLCCASIANAHIDRSVMPNPPTGGPHYAKSFNFDHKFFPEIQRPPKVYVPLDWNYNPYPYPYQYRYRNWYW